MAEFGIGSDYKTLVKFTGDGVDIDASAAEMAGEFTLDFYVGSETYKKTASKIDGVYTNCGFEAGTTPLNLYVAFDDVTWGEGDVICKATFYYDASEFADDIRKVVRFIETGDSYVRL